VRGRNEVPTTVYIISILKLVHPLKQKGPDLPELNGPLSEKVPSTAIAATKAKVGKALDKEKSEKKRKSSRFTRRPLCILNRN